MKFELTSQDSEGGKNFTVLTSMDVNRKSTEIRPLFSIEMTLNMNGRDLQFPKPYKIVKGEKYAKFCVSKLLIWRQKWVADISLVFRRVAR